MNLRDGESSGTWPQRLARSGVRGGLALLLSVLLPVSSVAVAAVPMAPSVPAGGGADQAAAASRYPTSQQENPSSKVHKQVNDAFTSARQVTYLVKLRDQADVNGAAAAARKTAGPAQREVAARSAVIKALKNTAESSQRGLLSQLEVSRKYGEVTDFKPFWITNMVAVTSSVDVMKQIARRSDVAQILPDAQFRLIARKPEPEPSTPVTTADPGAQSVEWGVQRVAAPAVWSQYGNTGQGAVVAGMDTGVDWNHPALRNNWAGYDPATGQTNPTYSWFDAVNGQAMPYDDHGHGTHTIGTAVGQDGENQIGVAPGARWIGVKILNGAGSGSSANILTAAQWLLAPGGDPSKAPDVVNNSWGGGPGVDDWMRDLVNAWRAAGIFPAFAAGNDGPGDGSVSVPGNYPESFAVGATDINDNLASFSGRGPSAYGVMKPQVSAPGVNVRSAVPGGGYEGGWSGTSMATPHVAGAVALLRTANAALTVEQIEAILINSAEPMTDSRYSSVPNNGFGHGILNAYTAVGMVINGVGSVSGRVVTGGDDFTPPALTHTPVTEAFKRIPVGVSATVSDDVSVTGAFLRFRMPGMSWWGEVEMARTSGDYKSGAYEGAIPAEMTGGNSVEYYIVARDYGGNESTSGTALRPHSVTLMNGVTPGYRQDFEGAATGWTHGGTNDSWQIGEPTSGPGSAHAGMKVAATNLSGNYLDSSESYLMSPPIDLSGVPAATLRFWHWFDLERNFDFGHVIGSRNGGASWQILRSYTDASAGWREVMVDLTPLAGSNQVLLAFYLQSDESITKAGWYVDDVELYVDTDAPAAPGNLTAEGTPSGAIGLRWDPVTAGDLAHYTVYRSTTSGTGYTSLGNTARTEFIDGGVTGGTTYYYVVTASDIYTHESARSAEASATAAGATVVFEDNMEAGPGGWTHSGAGDSWALGAPTAGPATVPSGSNLWATNLSGNYPDNHNASLISPPINLSGLASASLQFAHWYSMEKDFDIGVVEISSNGGSSWTQVARYTSPDYGGTPVGWETPVIDLTSYAGQTIQFRFRLQSDGSVNKPGWYIDDVRVAGLPAAGGSLSLPLSVESSTELGAKGKPSPVMVSPQIKQPAQSNTFKQISGTADTSSVGVSSLPLSATVTVVETGRVVRTDPARGTFSMVLPAGTFTLRAEAYGFYPQERTVTVERDVFTSTVFVLQPIPRGSIAGRITNARTGVPVSGVNIALAEDPRVPAVTSGADGSYLIEAYEGRYTVEARATGFYPASTTATVTGGQTTAADMALEPFIGIPGEISYDDGTADNAWAYFAAGSGWAVRMSPARAGQATLLRGARFYHWDNSWPVPGGNTFRAAVFEAQADGKPGRMLGSVRATNAVRGGWTEVDLSGLGLTLTGDFFVAWIQDADYPNTPGLAVDESTRPTGRNWQFVNGTWAEWPDANVMIRALVDYEVTAPSITTPANGTYTNRTAVPVAGSAYPGTTVTLLVDGIEMASASTVADAGGSWSLAADLAEGAHELAAQAAVTGGGTTRPSAPVRVVVDMTNPTLHVAAPANGHTQSDRVITVTGHVADINLRGVTVNGTAAGVGADGNFMVELVGAPGDNTIAIEVADMAGNLTADTRTVHIDNAGPVLSNVQPGANMTLMTGDQVTIAFDAEPGLALAAFSINLTGAAGTSTNIGSTSLQPGENGMTEVSPGHYEATYTLPDGVAAPSARVQVRAVDAAGNETRAVAAGVLTLMDNDRPTAVIVGPTTARKGTRLTYDGRSSRDTDGQVTSWVWEWGDGTSNTSGNRVTHVFRNAGTYTVRLTVTDNRGGTGTATMTVRITN